MAIFRRTKTAPAPESATLQAAVAEARGRALNLERLEELMQESLAREALDFHDGDSAIGWMELAAGSAVQRRMVASAVDTCRLMRIRNPLIQSACEVIAHYVWGEGVEIRGTDEDVNAVVQQFVSSRGSRKTLFGATARIKRDDQLSYEGNLFLSLHRNPISGRVALRSIPFDQVFDIVSDPDDSTRPWCYLRRWHARTLTSAGEWSTTERKLWMPAWDWRAHPDRPPLPASIDGVPVAADPTDPRMYHLATGGLADWEWGVPPILSVIDWARAYKDYLTNWSSLMDSLATWAWKTTTTRGQASALKTQLESTLGQGTTPGTEANPSPTKGAVAIVSEGADLVPIPKTGATMSAEDAKALRLMVATGTSIPDPILSGDPQQGTLATAKSLDRPTELAMMSRQSIWHEVLTDLTGYAVASAVEAPGGTLRGQVLFDGEDTTIELAGDSDPTVDVKFPPILHDDVTAAIDAVTKAAALLDGRGAEADQYLRFIAGEVLSALSVDDIDGQLTRLFPDIA